MRTKSANDIIKQSKKIMKALRGNKCQLINGGVMIMTDVQRNRHKRVCNTCIRYVGNIARHYDTKGLTGIIDNQVSKEIYSKKYDL